MKHELPIKYSYKVADNFFAGEYPFKENLEEGILKLKMLLDFGVKTFVDLTNEPLTPYKEHLPPECKRLHFPTEDNTCPQFQVLNMIHQEIALGQLFNENIYVHCKGGYDRTGVVIATYFIFKEMTVEEAKKNFKKLFVSPIKGRYSHRPLIETDWEVLDDYEKWLKSNA
jgi:protein-tyrosine phosphatase